MRIQDEIFTLLKKNNKMGGQRGYKGSVAAIKNINP
jgi:hypothetical protein